MTSEISWDLKQRPPYYLSSLKHTADPMNPKEEDNALTEQMKKIMMEDLQHSYTSEKVKKVVVSMIPVWRTSFLKTRITPSGLFYWKVYTWQKQHPCHLRSCWVDSISTTTAPYAAGKIKLCLACWKKLHQQKRVKWDPPNPSSSHQKE